jgi:hypothetical protein
MLSMQELAFHIAAGEEHRTWPSKLPLIQFVEQYSEPLITSIVGDFFSPMSPTLKQLRADVEKLDLLARLHLDKLTNLLDKYTESIQIGPTFTRSVIFAKSLML